MALLLEHRANTNLRARLKSKFMNAYQMAVHKGNQGAAKMTERAAAHTLPHGHTLGNPLMKYKQQNVLPLNGRAETRPCPQQTDKSDGTEADKL